MRLTFSDDTKLPETLEDVTKQTTKRKVLRWMHKLYIWSIAKYVLIAVVLGGYAFAGAGIFYAIEKPAQDERLELQKNLTLELRKNVTDALVHLAKTCFNMKVNHCENETMELIRKYDEAHETNDTVHMWTFWNSFYYASTIYTTIGFGNVYCYTRTGQGLTIIYALIGIPLMLTALKYIGETLFIQSSLAWRYIRRKVKRMHRSYKEGSRHRKKLSFVTRQESSLEMFSQTDDVNAVFPLPLAITIIALYILLVAGLICAKNPGWDYFTAIYYFFISLSTIGLGDKIALPDNHNYVLSFIYTVIGLALVSMCINVMQNRVERTYAKALESMETILQLSGALDEDDENGCISPYKEHPDWSMFRASQVLGTLNIRRTDSKALLRLSDRSSNFTGRRPSHLDHLYQRRPQHQFRQSIQMYNNLQRQRSRTTLRSMERQATRLKSWERQATVLQNLGHQVAAMRRESSVFGSKECVSTVTTPDDDPKRISKLMNVRFSVADTEAISRASVNSENKITADGTILERY